MSLLVWLPLHGNLNNYGLSPAKFTMVNNSGGLTTATGGKTNNSCYRRATKETADYITSDINFTMDGDYSMCCWCKVTDFGTNNSANGIITHHGHTTGGGGITMRYLSASDYRMSINTGVNNNERTYNTYYSTTNIYNAWHHLCMTYSRSERKYRMYIDGKQETIKTDSGNQGDSITLNDGIHARPFRLFDWSVDHSTNGSYRPPCYLNDVRLYDHCLSNKEIEEIARGLVAHYPLKGMGSTNYLIGGDKFTKNSPLVRNANDSSAMNDSYIYHTNVLSATVDAETTYTWILESDGVPTSHPTTGTSGSSKYFSMWLQNTSSQVHYLWNSMGTGPDGRHYGSVTIPAGTYVVRTNLYAADKVNYTVKFWNMKLIKGNYNPNDIYCPHTSDSLYSKFNMGAAVREDYSGYANNLSQVGSVLMQNENIKYGSCVNFNNSGYFYSTAFNLPTEKFTVSFWLKIPSSINSQHFLFGTHNTWTENGFAAWRDSGGNTYSLLIKSNQESSHGGSSIAPLPNTWMMASFVYTGTELIVYENGTEVRRITYGKNGIVNHPVMYLGNSTYNNAPTSEIDQASMSDFRFYVTALTSEQIADLYHSAAAIDDKGTLLTGEVREGSKSNIYQANTTHAKQLNERALDMMTRKSLSDGSQWARIFYHKNNAGTVLFSSVDEALETNSTYKFSQLKYLNNYRANDGKFEFMLTCKELAGGASLTSGYNRWKQSSNPCEEYVAGTDGSKNATGYEPISISWNTNYWGGLGLQNASINTKSACLLSGSTGHGNWFYAIGAYEAWGGGIPGPNAAVEETELWVRIDTLPKMQINNSGNIIANNFIER